MDDYFISDFLAKLTSSEIGEPTWGAIENHFDELGFDSVTFGIINKRSLSAEGLFSNVSKDWMNYYIDQGFIFDDPFAAYVAKEERDTIVTEHSIRSFIGTDSNRAMDVYLGGAEVGVKSTFVSPYHHAHKEHIVGFNLGSSKNSQEFERFVRDKKEKIILSTSLAQAFTYKFTSDKDNVGYWFPTEETTLTARELEVLNWLAGGYRVDRISDKMTISNDTVNFHIKSIKRKLNAKTREHAVALGFLNQIIR
jgi:DNA-binding CsgD family transcriptional regulator